MKDSTIFSPALTPRLAQAFTASLQDLQQVFERHCALAAALFNEQENGWQATVSVGHKACGAREKQLAEAIEEAIDVLEESRKAFKSKQLERLRKKLTRTLMDQG